MLQHLLKLVLTQIQKTAEACAEALAEQCADILALTVPAAAYAHACTEGAAALHGD